MAESVGELSIGLNLDSSGVAKGTLDATKVLNKLDSVIATSIQGVGKLESTLVGISTSATTMSNGVNKANQTLGVMKTSLTNILAKAGETKSTIVKMSASMNRSMASINQSVSRLKTNMLGGFSTVITQMASNTNKLTTSLQGVQRAVKETSSDFTRVTTSINRFSSQSTANINRVIGAINGFSTKARGDLYNLNLAVGQVERAIVGMGRSGGILNRMNQNIMRGNTSFRMMSATMQAVLHSMQRVEASLVRITRNTGHTNAGVSRLDATMRHLNLTAGTTGSRVTNVTNNVNRMGNAFRTSASGVQRMAVSMNMMHDILSFMSSWAMVFPRQILKAVSEFEKMQTLTKGIRTKEFSNTALPENVQQTQSTSGINSFLTNATSTNDINFIYGMAKKVPFELSAIQDAFVKLKVGGIEPTNGSLQTLIDSIAKFGGDSEILKRAAIAIQQMGGKGVVSMEELRQQLGEAVPDAMQAMADGLGWSMQKLQKEISLAHVSAKTGITAMLIELKKRNEGASEAFMKTWTGSVAKLKTTIDLFFIDIAKEGFMDNLKGSVQQLTETIASKDFKSFASSIGSVFAGLVTSLGNAVNVLIQFKDIVIAIGGLWLFKNGVGWVKSFTASLALGGENTLKWWKGIIDRVKQAPQEIQNAQNAISGIQARIDGTYHAQTNPNMGKASGQELADLNTKLTEQNAKLQEAKRNSTALGAVWQELTGGAGNLAGLVKNVAVQLTSFATQALIAYGAMLAFQGLKAIWDDLSGETARRLEESLQRVNDGMGTAEDISAVTEEWKKRKEVQDNLALTLESLAEGTQEYAEAQERLNKAKEEGQKYEDAVEINAGKEKADDWKAWADQQIQKINDLQSRKQMLENMLKEASAEERADIQNRLNQVSQDLGVTQQVFMTEMERGYKEIGVQFASDISETTMRHYAIVKGMLDSITQRAVTAIDNAGGKNPFANMVANLGKANGVKVQMPKSFGSGGSSNKKKGFGSGGRKGRSGGGGSNPGDWIKELQSQRETLEAENQALMEGVATLEDIEKKAEALVKQHDKKGQLKGKQREEAKRQQIALLKEKTANELLKKSTDDLSKAQEEAAWTAVETKNGYADLSSGVLGLAKNYAQLERKLDVLKGKDGKENDKYYDMIKSRQAEAIMTQALVDANNDLTDVKNKEKELDASWVADEGARRIATMEAVIGKIEAQEKVNLDYYTKMQQQYKGDADKVAYYEAQKAQIVEAFEAKKRLARKQTLEDSMTANQKQEAEWANVTKNMEEASKSWASNFTKNIQTMVEGGEVSWRSFLAGMISDMNRILIEKAFGGLINQMFDSIGSAASSVISTVSANSPMASRDTGQIVAQNQNTIALETLNGSMMALDTTIASSIASNSGNIGAQAVGGVTDYSSMGLDALGEKVSTVTNDFSNLTAPVTGITEGISTAGTTLGATTLATQLMGATQETTSMTLGVALGELTISANLASQALMSVATSSSSSQGSGWLSALGSAFSTSAMGNVISKHGPMKLKKYANGGIANSPHLALFGEGSKPEAFVPLPDGRSIPVTMTGGQNMGGSYTPVSIQINVENNGDTSSESSSSNNDQNKMWGNLAQRIKGMVVEEIATQKRPGGVLYAK